MKACRFSCDLLGVALGVLASLSGSTAMAQRPTASTADTEAQTAPVARERDAPQIAAPQIAAPLPGTSRTRLTSSSQYVSTLVSQWTSPRSRSTSRQLAEYYRSRSRSNLLRVPEMFGDFRNPGNQLRIAVGTISSLDTEVPVAAGIGGLRIAEDNQALPSDRFWVSYNYFRNAFDNQPQGIGAGPGSAQSLHRIVIAREFLLDQGRTSVEVRLPFGAAVNATGTTVPATAATAFEVESDSIGNLSVILKRLLYADSHVAWSAGLGVETPTGSSGDITVAGQRVIQEVNAVHLIPYLALTRRVDRWFGHAFAQLDVSTGGDELLANAGAGTAVTTVGRVDQAPLLGLDIGVGYWLKRPCCDRAWGIATVAELHYTTALDRDDTFTVISGISSLGVNTPAAAPRDLLNVTAGLVLSGGNGWSMRLGIVAPIRDQRAFDTEAILQLNRSL